MSRSLSAATIPALALAASLAAPGQAKAQPVMAPGQWDVRLGAGMGFGPAYPGSDVTMGRPAPLVDISYRTALPLLDTVFLNNADGLGFVAYRNGGFQAGASVNYAPGRDQDDNRRLQGMGDIGSGGRASIFARQDFGNFTLGLRGSRYLGLQDGTTIDASAALRQQFTPQFMAIARIEATWGDSDYMQQWFGVSRSQSIRSGYGRYDASAGFRSAALSLTGHYAVTPRWSVMGTVGIARLFGDAADSPITESKTQPFGFAGVAYRF
ncbi:MipA/OmpV family protein [Acetobacteraceae bacterium H6797]|nr:MipA/OmpV family protein [Acetobacteraceae bacterium H6797]